MRVLTFPDPAAAYPAGRFTQIRTPSPGQGPTTVPVLPLSLTPTALLYRRFTLPARLLFLQPSGARRDSPTIAQLDPCPTRPQCTLHSRFRLSPHQIFKLHFSLFSITSSLFHFSDLSHLFLFLLFAHSCTKKGGGNPPWKTKRHVTTRNSLLFNRAYFFVCGCVRALCFLL